MGKGKGKGKRLAGRRRVRVTRVVERDTDRTLFRGEDLATGRPVTFHVGRGHAAIADNVSAGRVVVVELAL